LQLPLWALTGLFVYRAVVDGRSTDWILSGIWLALAFWTKYAAVALAIPIGLVLLVDPLARRAWRSPGPYLMAAAFFVVLAPHLAWLVTARFLASSSRGRARPGRDVLVRAHYVSATLDRRPGVLPAADTSGCSPLWLSARAAQSPADGFARRYVTVLALGPFVLVTLGTALLGRLALAMWGYPLWTFLPLAAMVWFEPVTEVSRLRLFGRACLIVLLAMPIAYAADELFEPFLRDRPKATQFPGQLLAQTITELWHDRTGTPLVYVGGADFGSSGSGEFAANMVAVYFAGSPAPGGPRRPSLEPVGRPSRSRSAGSCVSVGDV